MGLYVFSRSHSMIITCFWLTFSLNLGENRGSPPFSRSPQGLPS